VIERLSDDRVSTNEAALLTMHGGAEGDLKVIALKD